LKGEQFQIKVEMNVTANLVHKIVFNALEKLKKIEEEERKKHQLEESQETERRAFESRQAKKPFEDREINNKDFLEEIDSDGQN